MYVVVVVRKEGGRVGLMSFSALQINVIIMQGEARDQTQESQSPECKCRGRGIILLRVPQFWPPKISRIGGPIKLSCKQYSNAFGTGAKFTK